MPRVEKERGRASRLAGCADLEDIRLFGSESSLDSPAFNAPLSFSLSSDFSFQTMGEPISTVVVSGKYEVVVNESDPDDDEAPEGSRTAVASLSFTLAALYSVEEPMDGPDPFDAEEFEAFAATTGQFTLYPYAREYIADVTGRMGLPALHIGPLRFELDSRDGD